MFDLGWPELCLVGAVAVLAIGPREMPSVLYQLGRVVRRFHYIRFVMSNRFEDFMRVHDGADPARSVNFEGRNPDTDDPVPDEKAADLEAFLPERFSSERSSEETRKHE